MRYIASTNQCTGPTQVKVVIIPGILMTSVARNMAKFNALVRSGSVTQISITHNPHIIAMNVTM